jgi:hypothetical protein
LTSKFSVGILPKGVSTCAFAQMSSMMPTARSLHGLGPSHSVIGSSPSFTYSAPSKIIASRSTFSRRQPFFENE